jgi:SAM-dependent methyltransferase
MSQGMRVLDVGCATGDVAFQAARAVGPDGEVIGIDSSVTAIAAAHQRARDVGVTNVSFEVADLDRYGRGGFDAVVGRFVLMHQPDPVATVWRLASLVREGGLLAFQEFDFSQPPLVRPELKLVVDSGRWIASALRGLGFDVGMGMRLHQVFRSAGLARPSMIVGAAVESGQETAVCDLIGDTVREFLDPICALGIATPDEIGVQTLALRIRQAALETDAVIVSPLVVSAWTRVARRSTGPMAVGRD